MTLAELLVGAGLAPLRADLPGAEVTGVAEDSRDVRPGNVFVVVRGTKADGAAFTAAALAAGAVAVASEPPRPAALPAGVPWFEVGDARCAVARLAAAFHQHPGRALTLTGVTGSKGKTTTSWLVAAVAETAGEPTALLGTVVYRTGASERPAPLTTPSAVTLQALLREAVDAKMAGAVLEVSSHALDQERVHGLSFDVGIFTNLLPDHLDYHTSVEEYFEAKRRLFAGQGACDRAVVGIDGAFGRRIAAGHPRAITFGSTADADVRPLSIEAGRQGTKVLAAVPGGRQVVLDSPLIGRFNQANLLAAAAYGVARGFDLEAVREGVRAVECVPGRMEPVDLGQPFTCLVDFSHTGSALAAALEAVREWTSGRVLVVFGAGGNRDHARRIEMGEAAARLADEAILTSDNPRDEDPLDILRSIEAAYRAAAGGVASVVPDRAEAIAAAVDHARPGDTILVAGKGHETVQIVGGERRPFDNRLVLAEALRARGYAG